MTDNPAFDPSDIDAVKAFDLAGWIEGTKRPERSTVLYARPDLYAELDRVTRDMRLAGSESGETSVADKSALAKLQKEYEKIAREIDASAMTFTIRAANDDAMQQARREVKQEKARDTARSEWDDQQMADDIEADARDEAELEGMTDSDDIEALVRKRVLTARQQYISVRVDLAFQQCLLARLMVKPRVENVAQLRELLNRVGPTQANKLYELMGQANRDLQVPSAPFSPPSSQAKRGGTSSKK